MIFSPFITRLYGAEIFGQQGVFISLVSLASVIAALGYPTAIVLPKSDTDAIGLVWLCILISVGTSIITAVIFYFYGMDILRLLNAETVAPFVLLIPVAMFISGLASVLGQWLMRKKEFALTAKYGVFTTLLVSIAKTGLGFLHPTALILILTNTLGALTSAILTYLGWRKRSESHSSPFTVMQFNNLVGLAVKHRDFPLLRTPQNLINAFSQNLPILILASYFGTSSAGQYTLAISVLGVPAALIGGSVMSVFYPRVTEAIQNGENARTLIIKATVGMAVTGAPFYLIMTFLGPVLFEFIFGVGWHTAGIYAQWLSVWLFFAYTNRPAVSAIPSLNIQSTFLIFEIVSIFLRVLSLHIGFSVIGNDIAAIAIFCIAGTMLNIFLIYFVIAQSSQ